jgi:hypothetical protein
MGRSNSPKRTSYILVLPLDLLHIILSKLNFRDKVNAGLVCKQWEELLTASTPAARHWIVDYNIDRVVNSPAFTTANMDSFSHQPSLVIVRCVIMLPIPLAGWVFTLMFTARCPTLQHVCMCAYHTPYCFAFPAFLHT